MECIFSGINTTKCLFEQKCWGIHYFIEELGGSPKVANIFSKYIWRRSVWNKIKDIKQDPTFSITGKIRKLLVKMLFPIFQRHLINTDSDFERKLTKMEYEVSKMEMKASIHNPLQYFQKVGQGYGLIFDHIGQKYIREVYPKDQLWNLGVQLGILVSLRDSLKDWKKDRKSGSFNPFKTWSNSRLIQYYKKTSEECIQKISKILQEIKNQLYPKSIDPFLRANQNHTSIPKIHLKSVSALSALLLYAETSRFTPNNCPRKSSLPQTKLNLGDIFQYFPCSSPTFPVGPVLLAFGTLCAISICCIRTILSCTHQQERVPQTYATTRAQSSSSCCWDCCCTDDCSGCEGCGGCAQGCGDCAEGCGGCAEACEGCDCDC